MSRASLFDPPALPDASRDENGFAVRLTLLPDLAAPIAGLVEVTVENGKIVLDTIDVTPVNAYDVYRHTTLYSERLRAFLDRSPVPLPEMDGSDEETYEHGGAALYDVEQDDDTDIPF